MPRITTPPSTVLLLDLPDVIDTKRLELRCPRAGDGEKHHEAVVDSIDTLRQFPASLSWASQSPSVESSEAFCRQSFSKFAGRTGFAFLIYLRGTDTMVGAIDLHNFDWSVPKCEMGWWGRTSYNGQGLMREATDALIQYAFNELNIHRISALTDVGNIRSSRLCESVNMQLEGVIRNERKAPDGTLRNTCLYAVIR